MALTVTAPPPASPAATWKALAHLIAARPTIRVWNPDTDKFDRARHLTSRLPQHPAAVLLYQHGRTPLLALDFDTKHHGQDVVDADFGRALSWITEAGGVAVTDRSTSGGRHILVPLAIGTTATLAEIIPLMRLLEARLPSLDKTPMTNPKTGCITAPGSACRQGGHRVLDGPLAAAIDALTTRSEPSLLPRLHMLLGALPSPACRRPVRRRHTQRRPATTPASTPPTPATLPCRRASPTTPPPATSPPTAPGAATPKPANPSWPTPRYTATAWPPSAPSPRPDGPGTPAWPPPTPGMATTPTKPSNATSPKP